MDLDGKQIWHISVSTKVDLLDRNFHVKVMLSVM